MTRQTASPIPNNHGALVVQDPATVWLTGLPGAGKTTLAFALETRLLDLEQPCLVLDGDDVRNGLNRDLGFSPADRRENLRRAAEVARLGNSAGMFVITAFISPYREHREMAREIVGPERFIETYIATPREVCEKRDPKGHYAKARDGLIPEYTGVTAPYEKPMSPALIIDAGMLSVEECVAALLHAVAPRFNLRSDRRVR